MAAQRSQSLDGRVFFATLAVNDLYQYKYGCLLKEETTGTILAD